MDPTTPAQQDGSLSEILPPDKWRAARATGRATARGVRACCRGIAAAARMTSHASRRGGASAYHLSRRASTAHGAGETGLSRLLEVHALSTGGDTAVAVALAGSMFFAAPTAQARGQVALFLAMTMVPFLLVAPLIGPFLDRYRHGRRWAIGVTMAGRAWLTWVLAGAIGEGSWVQFPAVLLVLVLSRAYSITRSASVPRVLPRELTLVKANGRMSLAGVVGGMVLGPVAAGLSTLGPEWVLRFCFAVFCAGTVLAILLPPAVDSQRHEQVGLGDLTGTSTRRSAVPPIVVTGLRGNLALRAAGGFLAIYLAFLLREHPLSLWGLTPTLMMGGAVGAMAVGNGAASVVGSVLRSQPPRRTIMLSLIADIVAFALAALLWGLPALLLLPMVVGFCQQAGKLALDALIQDGVEDTVRTSAFARSETVVQVGFVIGGALGLVLPSLPSMAYAVVAVLLTAWLVAVARWQRRPDARSVVPVNTAAVRTYLRRGGAHPAPRPGADA